MLGAKKAAAAALVFCVAPYTASAYPVLDAVQGLPSPELITVYPDDANPNLYYFVPTSVALARDENGTPRLGVQYWGLTAPDPEGAGAALTFSVRPAFDKKLVDSVAEEVKKKNKSATFAFPTLVSSKMDVLINGAFAEKNQDTTDPSVSGGTVDATQAFTIALTKIGGRAFAQGVAADSDILGARYTYKFLGVEKRLHARITVYNKRVYDHFKVTSSASAWWGMVRSSWSADWQKLVSDGSIVVDILEGGETDTDAYMLEVFKTIVNAKVGETGMFAPKLKPGGIAGAPESSNWGWGFSGGGGWEHLEEKTNVQFEINTQKLGEREFQVGLSFNAVCAAHPDNFVDLTILGNKCIDKDRLGETATAMRKCVDAKLDHLLKLKNEGKIPEKVWETQVTKVYDEICVPESEVRAMLNLPDLTVERTNACTDRQLSTLLEWVNEGRMTQEAWERNAAVIVSTPCRADALVLPSLRTLPVTFQPEL